MLCREFGHELLSSLTAFTNLILAGGCPADISPIFFGGRLLALSKKSDGVRPIAIGFTLRRLASKCANSVASVQLRDYFGPRQLGVGIPDSNSSALEVFKNDVRYINSRFTYLLTYLPKYQKYDSQNLMGIFSPISAIQGLAKM